MESIPITTKLLHLYRSLLRESTYLPDSSSRLYFHHWITHRFHASSSTPSQVDLHKARRALHRLERANKGNLKSLHWVLQNTYGRIGKRRRELISQLLSHHDEHLIPSSDEELKALILANANATSDTKTENKRTISTKLRALINSHIQSRLKDSPRLQLRHKAAVIPKTNIWGRPTPLKAAAGLEEKWWANTIDKILPPLPKHEHLHLQNLAFGLKYESPPTRRAPIPPINKNEIAKFIQPIKHVEKEKEDILERKNHKLTKRFMQRLWMKVLSTCPIMTQKEEEGKWKVEWPKEKEGKGLGKAGDRDLELFEGCEGDGERKEKKVEARLPRKVVSERKGLTEVKLELKA